MSKLLSASPIPASFTRAAFPLGGIGTGNVSIGARGEYRDWEVENRPDKDRLNPNTFFAIHVRPAGGSPVSRVLEARDTGRRDWDEGYAFAKLAGLPRLTSATMRGEYPFAEVEFEDQVLPVDVVLTAFTPLIPLDAAESGIPGAVLRYTVTNPGLVTAAVTVAGSLSHIAGLPAGERWENDRAMQSVAWRDQGDLRGLDFGVALGPTDPAYGTMSLVTTDAAVTAMPEWCNNKWPDGAQLFWEDFASDGRLSPLGEKHLVSPDSALTPSARKLRTGSLAITHELASGESRDFEFILAWSFPNRRRCWEGDAGAGGNQGEIGRNFYATLWPDSWSAARHLAMNLPRLEAATWEFHDALYASSLDPAVLDALSATIATLRSTTCFRFDDGSFFGWEGSMDHGGSCFGTCTHVWSYAQTVAWLFPELERSARSNEYLCETTEDGVMRFRTNTPFGEPWDHPPAVDGQLGTLLRLHREWRFSGDDQFLRELWEPAKRTLEYAIRTWDIDGDGLLDARMHNTYDIEFEGAEPLSNVMFVAAVRAAACMASHVGDHEDAERYGAIAAKTANAIEDRLYNGEYYQQRTENADAQRYQYGDGVLSDQLVGQFHAHINGLGFVLPEQHVRAAVHSIFVHNFRGNLEAHESTQRVYALNDEGGLLLASWPRGGRPELPFVYADEVWTGIEYQVATELIYCGYHEEAVTLIRTLRERYDGRYRSPWNEIECGNHYVRSMASWGLLLAFSGVQWDAVSGSLSFDPVFDGSYFFTTKDGWGRATVAGDQLVLAVSGGNVTATTLSVRGRKVGSNVRIQAGSVEAFQYLKGSRP